MKKAFVCGFTSVFKDLVLAIRSNHRNQNQRINLLHLRFYIMSTKIFYSAFITTFQFCSGSLQAPFPPLVISDLHHITPQYWNKKHICYFKSGWGSGFKNPRPHKCSGLMLHHIIQCGSQVIIHDLCSLGTALVLCNSFLPNTRWLRDEPQLRKIPQAPSWVAAVRNASNRRQLLSPETIHSHPPTAVKFEVH